MKYIIMADGKGSRWNNYKNIPKHLVEVEGEVLLERTVRLINELDSDSEVIITSHDKRYEFEGSTRYEPKNNVLEIDRFTYELIEDNVCFLYGDTYYTEETMEKIINTDTDELLFFGNNKSIVAIKVKDSEVFKENINKVKELFLKNKIKNCKGWQVYQSYQNLEFDKKQIGDRFVVVDEKTIDYNTPEEYENKSIKRTR